jgi:hypothetical protein
VGDLVTYQFQRTRWRKGQTVHVGLIVETGKFTGNCDVRVLWQTPSKTETLTEKSDHLCLVDKHLTS